MCICSTSGKFTDGLSHAWKVRLITFEWLNIQMNMCSVHFSPLIRTRLKKAFLSYIVDRKICCHSFVPRMSCCEPAVLTLAEKSQTSHIFWCHPCSAYQQEASFVVWSEPLRVLVGFPGRLLIDCHHNDLIPEIDTPLKEDPQLFITWVCADPHHKRKKMT